jgi:hypothetical protein
MARGALLGFLAASFIVSLAVAWVAATQAPGLSPRAPGPTHIVDMLLFRLTGTPPAWSFVWPGGLYLLGAALVGAGTGVLASRLRGPVKRRSLILLAISPLGPWLLAAAMVAIPPLSNLGDIQGLKAVGFAAVMPVLSLPLALPYVVIVAPLVAPPVILGHLVLEGWTRPAQLPMTGFARPGVRQKLLMVLVSATAALATFAVLKGSPWTVSG